MVAKEGKGLPCCCFRLQPVGWKEKEKKMKEREEDGGVFIRRKKYYNNVVILMILMKLAFHSREMAASHTRGIRV